MSKRELTIERIIASTGQILLKEGASQLSMRKVADAAGISLSNLQYYFSNREALLHASIESYFAECRSRVQESLLEPFESDSIDLTGLMRHLLTEYFSLKSTQAQCAMFREIWALATRDPKIADLVNRYYMEYTTWLIEQLNSFVPKPEPFVSLLLPYLEGFSIMGETLPLQGEALVKVIVKAVFVAGGLEEG